MIRNGDASDSVFDAQNGDDDREIDEMVARYIDRINAGQRIDPEEILDAEPTLGAEILDRLETFIDAASEMTQSRPRVQTLGDYRLGRQIGRGGMGVVYEAWQTSMDRQVALKVLPAGAAADDRSFHRFMREARMAGKLSHPNVVAIHGMGVEANTPYYAMELVEGETVAEALARLRRSFGGEEHDEPAAIPFSVGEGAGLVAYVRIAAAFAEVVDGLQHAHSKGIVHRDIKPSNLIIDPENKGEPLVSFRIRILDFGLAHLEGQGSLTLSADILGTPLYMCPEPWRRSMTQVYGRNDRGGETPLSSILRCGRWSRNSVRRESSAQEGDAGRSGCASSPSPGAPKRTALRAAVFFMTPR